ncbi:hypothetical protein ACZ87_03206, partial [Candidatus Erwinia dacicola]
MGTHVNNERGSCKMKIFVINLKGYLERRKSIAMQLNKLN